MVFTHNQISTDCVITLCSPMILNSLARETSGIPTVNQGISLTNLFNEEIIEKIAASHAVDSGLFLLILVQLVQD